MGSDWMYYVMVAVGPLYLKEVLLLQDAEVSLLTGIPYILPIPCVYLAGSLSDRLVARGVLTNTQIRKLNDAVAKLMPASVVVCLSYIPEKSVVGVAVLNCLGTTALGFSSLSWAANPVDLAPAWAGLLAGLAQFGSVWVSFVVPVVFNHLTAGRTREEWRLAFFITAVIQVLTFTFYWVFASGEVQPWAVTEKQIDDVTATGEITQVDMCSDVTPDSNHDNDECVNIECHDVTESKAMRESRTNYGATLN